MGAGGSMTHLSVESFRSIRPFLNNRQMEVILALKRLGGMATMHEVGLYMKKPLNSISGRFSELSQKQMITPCGVDKSPQYRPRTIYRLVEWPKLLTESPKGGDSHTRKGGSHSPGYLLLGDDAVRGARGERTSSSRLSNFGVFE
jgi:hypothetical protein